MCIRPVFEFLKQGYQLSGYFEITSQAFKYSIQCDEGKMTDEFMQACNFRIL